MCISRNMVKCLLQVCKTYTDWIGKLLLPAKDPSVGKELGSDEILANHQVAKVRKGAPN